MTTKTSVTVAAVNRALRSAGYGEKLRRGRGYYFFSGGQAETWKTSGVYVYRVDQLTVEQWLDARSRLARGQW